MMRFLLLFSRQGKLRLQKWFTSIPEREKKKIIRDMTTMVLARKPRSCNFLHWRDLKIVYKRYASLYFCIGMEDEENELLGLEVLHRYVELLDKYFGSVRPDSFSIILLDCKTAVYHTASVVLNRDGKRMDYRERMKCGLCLEEVISPRDPLCFLVCELDIIFNFEKAYFILDEFLMGGEIQETSKQMVARSIEASDMLQETMEEYMSKPAF